MWRSKGFKPHTRVCEERLVRRGHRLPDSPGPLLFRAGKGEGRSTTWFQLGLVILRRFLWVLCLTMSVTGHGRFESLPLRLVAFSKVWSIPYSPFEAVQSYLDGKARASGVLLELGQSGQKDQGREVSNGSSALASEWREEVKHRAVSHRGII